MTRPSPMLPAVLVLAATLAGPARAADASVDVRCFSDAAGKVQLEFRVYGDEAIGWVGGQVRYRTSKTYIPLAFAGSTTLQDIEDRPSEFRHRWLEIVDGRINGEYALSSQGANVYGFEYVGRRTGKRVSLPKASLPDESGACAWDD